MAASLVPFPALPAVQVKANCHYFCNLKIPDLIRISLCGSIYLVTSVAIERHSAVCNPLAYRCSVQCAFSDHLLDALIQGETQKEIQIALLHSSQFCICIRRELIKVAI